MKVFEFRDILIPSISAYIGRPLIEADQDGPRPPDMSPPILVYATYKFTTPYAKDGGLPNEVAYESGDNFYVKQDKTHRTTISFTAYAMDNDASYDLAQSIRDWFEFMGVESMQAAGIAVVDITGVDNRDAFVVDEYERRNGFDVILRAGQELLRVSTYIQNADITRE